jgi:NTE family protein
MAAALHMSLGEMSILKQPLSLSRTRRSRRCALALAGGGVVGGMYEVGAVAAIEERLAGRWSGFDIYVGCSAGSVVASLLANGLRASELYQILDQDLPDPLNFRRGAVFSRGTFRRASVRLARLLWAVSKNVMHGVRRSIPDMLARAERDMPAGFFQLDALERFMRSAFAARRLTNDFSTLGRRLLIPAVDLDRAQRAVFGRDDLREVPISRAIAASSAIPGFFEPYRVNGRDYVDGGVGFSGHADLAAEAGADLVLVVNPLVPMQNDGEQVRPIRTRGMYSIMDQASRLSSQHLLDLGLEVLKIKFPRTRFHLIQPARSSTPLVGPSMGFESSRAALRYGYTSTKAWLDGEGASLVRRLAPGASAQAAEAAADPCGERYLAAMCGNHDPEFASAPA